MKLTGNLKKKVEAAESRDEAKRAIESAGMLLTDDELDAVNGGDGATHQMMTAWCPLCQAQQQVMRLGPRTITVQNGYLLRRINAEAYLCLDQTEEFFVANRKYYDKIGRERPGQG